MIDINDSRFDAFRKADEAYENGVVGFEGDKISHEAWDAFHERPHDAKTYADLKKQA